MYDRQSFDQEPTEAMDAATAAACAADIDANSPSSRAEVSFNRPDNWDPTEPSQYTHHNEEVGQARFREVLRLHEVNEYDAYQVIRYALTSRNWKPNYLGLADGFAEAVARAAVAGLNAMACGCPAFDPADFANSADDTMKHVRIKGAGFESENFRYAGDPVTFGKAVVIPHDAHAEAMRALWAAAAIAQQIAQDWDEESGPSELAIGVQLLVQQAQKNITAE